MVLGNLLLTLSMLYFLALWLSSVRINSQIQFPTCSWHRRRMRNHSSKIILWVEIFGECSGRCGAFLRNASRHRFSIFLICIDDSSNADVDIKEERAGRRRRESKRLVMGRYVFAASRLDCIGGS